MLDRATKVGADQVTISSSTDAHTLNHRIGAVEKRTTEVWRFVADDETRHEQGRALNSHCNILVSSFLNQSLPSRDPSLSTCHPANL